MAFVIVNEHGNKLRVYELSYSEYRNLLTLQKWKKENPNVWKQIKQFVYDKKLNKKPSEHKKSLKKEPHPIFD